MSYQMSGLILLIIGLASLGLVVFALGYVGYVLWRLAKGGFRLARKYEPMVAELTRKAAIAEQRSEQASLDVLQIQHNLEHLQATLQKLQVIGEALSRAAQPYRRLRDYLGL
jgi:flagellar basal body-associated protein FliL